MAKPEPPRLAVMLLGWRLSKSSFEAIAGDLMEEFAARKRSRWWFWKHALSTLPRRFNFSAADHETRRSWQNPLASVFPDLRYAFRTLARTPSLTAAVLIATALGIGVNTGIFTLLNALVLRPLPAKDSGRVLSIYQELRNIKARNIHGNRSLVSWSEYEQYRDNNQVLSGLAAYAPFEASFGSAAGVRQVQGQLVSCDYFTILGRAPVLGRNFSSADCKSPGTSPYIIVSHVFWRTHLGGDATVLDKPVVVNRHKFTIIGVAPEGFPGTDMIVTDFWAPITMQEQLVPGEQYLADTNLSWLYLLGRLKPGRSVAEARANLDVIAKRIDQSLAPRETKLIIHVASLFSMPEARQAVLSVGAVVMIAVGLVLLIACANVANLLLSRASARQREIAIRLSIGATRARLIQQLLTESLLLAVAGGVLGAVVSLWTFDVFYRWVFSPP
jgi:predicted permease